MVKTYCDLCEKEVLHYSSNLMLRINIGDQTHNLLIRTDNRFEFDICKYCFIDEVNKQLDDREKTNENK